MEDLFLHNPGLASSSEQRADRLSMVAVAEKAEDYNTPHGEHARHYWYKSDRRLLDDARRHVIAGALALLLRAADG